MPITSFDRKTAFITGGGSGIGLGIAQVLVRRGARVVLADLRADHLEHAVDELRQAGAEASVVAIELDVTDRQAYAAVAERMKQDYDGIDARTRRGGHIVNTYSLAAAVYMPGRLAIYAASKAAVLNLSENMRTDLAEEGIGMSVLCPAFTKSNIHQAGRNRPAHLREGSGFAESERAPSERPIGDKWMEPEDVGEMVADAILNNQLYIVTHGDFRVPMQQRFEALMAATPMTQTLGLG